VLDTQIERRTNRLELHRVVNEFAKKVDAEHIICKRVDSNNKTIDDYLRVGRTKISVDDLSNEEFVATLLGRSDALSAFTSDGYTKDSVARHVNFLNDIDYFRHIDSSTLPSDYADSLKAYKCAAGMKTSRAFNKVCHYFEVDTAPMYNKEFAKYADMVSGLKRQIKFFISVNPLDYLTMSFGVNWASCHTIDKLNIRRMENNYSGGYCAGTMSYMLDSTSIVTYVHDSMPENYETGKIYRNMFHLGGDGVLLQGRVYPQGNDGCTDLYKEFRMIMQEEMAKVLGLESNKWTKRNKISNVNSVGKHYRDYNSFSDCNISYPSERPRCQEQEITVGSDRICPCCGGSADDLGSGTLSHPYCGNVFEF
jgi:hypothetical protein